MRHAFLIVLGFIPGIIYGQRFGGNSPSVKWQQINTDTARVIFPSGLDSQANRIASLVHALAQQRPVSLGDRQDKINIVLQNQTIVPNAYVGLGPYRSEFFLTPALNTFEQGSISWSDQLALHEYRHVQQFNNFRTGISNVMRVLFGEEGYALAVNAAVPDWFFEGDAVYSETVLSQQGRGRLPLFLNAYPAIWRAGKKYSWMKLRNGSLKDYVPDHYHLGYLLVNYGREKYGIDFWTRVTQDAAAFKGLFYPFQKAIKKHAGVDYKTFYTNAFEYYRGLNKETVPLYPQTAITPLNEKIVTSNLFPYQVSDDSMLYFKAANNKRGAFVIRDNQGEHTIRVRDISIDQQFSYRNGKVVYAAYETHPRWSWQDYSVIKLLDLKTNTQQTIARKTKYFTPDISSSGEKIAVVHIGALGKSELHILNTKTGNVITRVRSAEIALFTDPKFIDENTLVCAVRLAGGKSALAISDLSTGSIERLTTPSFNVTGYPAPGGILAGVVYFTASYGGNDDVFAVRLSDREIFRISNGPSGNYFVNAGNGKITWSAFTAEGYQLQQINENDINWSAPLEDAVVPLLSNRFIVSKADELPDILSTTATDREFPVSKYSKAKGLLNFHSWRPYYEDPEFSFTLYGQNVLNTTETQLYYLYNQNERTHAAGFNFIYGGLFPYLSAGTQYTMGYQRTVSSRLKQWDQLDARVGFNIPLTWTSGRSFKQLNFGTSYVYRNDFHKGVDKIFFPNINFSYLSHSISWSQQVQRAVQHIFPRLGYSLSLNYRHAITKYTSWQPFVASAVYLPGFFATHSIVLTGAFQETDTLNTLFSNRFSYSRGYNEAYFARMWRLSANYHFPIVYPDFGFANILYFQRLRGNAFFDFTKVYSRDKTVTGDQRSIGGELFIDTKWWNQYPLTFGFRVSRLLDNDVFTPTTGTVFEFILPVSIIPR